MPEPRESLADVQKLVARNRYQEACAALRFASGLMDDVRRVAGLNGDAPAKALGQEIDTLAERCLQAGAGRKPEPQDAMDDGGAS